MSTLFDVAEGSEAGTPCEGPGCTNTIPARPGRGRPRKTCSQSCKSRAARARTDNPRSTVTAEAGPAASPDGREQPADAGTDERDNYHHRVVAVAGALRTHADTFLAAVDADPMGAYKELMERVYDVTSMLNLSARDVRDRARWPGLDADERTEARMREEWNLPDAWTLAGGTPESDRSENGAPATAPDQAAEPDRSENSAAPAPASAAPIADRSENTSTGSGTAPNLTPAPDPAPDDGDVLLRAALADPNVRFSRPGRMNDLSFTFGEGWELVTWRLVDGDSVQLLRHHGAPVGWTALLPDGRWGLGGWIAVQHQGEGRPGRFVTDRFSRPQTFPSADLALDVFHRTTAPAAPAPGAGELADGVPVPDLALGEATGWAPPTLRGLGSPRRDYSLGEGLVHLTWRGKSGVQALEQRGQLAGWVEAYDEDGNWIAVITGRPVVDAADGVPLLSANPADALTLLRLAIGPGPRRPRSAPAPSARPGVRAGRAGPLRPAARPRSAGGP